MFCSKCGSNNSDDSKYCNSCGTGLNSNITIHTTSNETVHPTPVALIVTSWIIFTLSLFNNFLGMAMGIIVGLALLLCAILLTVNKNRIAKINGIILLVIWGITFIIGFVTAL